MSEIEPMDTLEITLELIEAGKSEVGGWNRRQFDALGVKWPPVKGWQERLVGKLITREDAKRFLDLKGATKRPRKIKGSSRIKSDLPFHENTGEVERRVVHSFWKWLSCQPVETRKKLSEPLAYILRKTNQTK